MAAVKKNIRNPTLDLIHSTECVTDLDERIEMIIFGSILTTFKLSIFLEAAGAVLKFGLRLKPNHHQEI